MTEIENSKFSRLIQSAITMNMDETVKLLYMLRDMDVLTESLEINYTDDLELMEITIRTLVDCDLLLHCLDRAGQFVVDNCPEEKQEEFDWFVKLFAYLESENSNWAIDENDTVYEPNAFHYAVFEDKRVNFDLDISKLGFLYYSVDTVFLN